MHLEERVSGVDASLSDAREGRGTKGQKLVQTFVAQRPVWCRRGEP
jgi:hypothetical protein